MSARQKCQAVAGNSVYDRLTNPAGYTGAHAARFGTTGSSSGAAPAAAPSQPAQPKLVKQSSSDSKTTTGTSGREKCRAVEGGSVFDRLTNPAGYTGAHAARFDSNGVGKGLAGRDSIAKGGADPRGLQANLRK